MGPPSSSRALWMERRAHTLMFKAVESKCAMSTFVLQVTGVLRGFDQFMNIVLDETIDEVSQDKNDIGLVVST